MSGGLTFLSWVRTGLISNAAPAAATGHLLDAPLPLTATLPVTLALHGGGEVRYEASVVGPGDVVGLDTRQVIRMDPAPGTAEIPANHFAVVEFDRPDLPWMLTPNAPALDVPDDPENPHARHGLRPWLCLVVVPDQALEPPTAGRPLPRLTVSDAELPELEQAWLWAHAQVLTVAGEDLKTLLAHHPERTLSRLVSPRRMKPGQGYLACVVPTFEAGRRAGLGLDPAPGETLTPAWTHGASPRPVQLPVYHSWRFRTSALEGDFQALAQRMEPTRFGLAGVRDLHVGHAGGTLPGPAEGDDPWIAPLEGVIVGQQVEPGAWPPDEEWPGELRSAIAQRLHAGEEELAPPTYGSLPGAHTGSLLAEDAPAWLRTLNLDPRYRATASLGTRLVQRHQEALMASAWEQSAEIREANRLLRQAQMAAAVGKVLAERVKRADPGRLLQMTSRAHEQVAAGGTAAAQARAALPLRDAVEGGDGGDGVAFRAAMREQDPTVGEAVRTNVSVHAAVSGAFRRVARPTGPLARRLAPEDAALEAPVERLGLPVTDDEAVRPAPPLEMPAGTVDVETVADGADSLAALTAARVATPVFSWEQGAPPPGAPPRVAVGYLADLVVVTRDRGTLRTAAGMGRALDFDGVAQQGWEALPAWEWPAATAQAQVDLPSFPNFAGRVGRVSFGIEKVVHNMGNTYQARTWITPGHTLEATGQRQGLGNLTSISTTPLVYRDVSVAGNDFAGTGSVDPVVAYVDGNGFPYLAVWGGGSWHTEHLGPSTYVAPSVAAAGSQVFALNLRSSHDARLRIQTLANGDASLLG